MNRQQTTGKNRYTQAAIKSIENVRKTKYLEMTVTH